ncbi:MAG: serine hydrolase [Thermoanaerobaculia bacterium]
MRRTAAALLFSLIAIAARADYNQFRAVRVDTALEIALQGAAAETLAKYPKLQAHDLAITVIDVTRADAPRRADLRGNAPFYPASVIKIFFMVDVYATGKELVADVDRALREMIVVSDNDATAYLVDVVSGTSAGAQLEGEALERFIARRRAINERFSRLGYLQMSAMAKPWSFGPFGRERQVLGADRVNRNRLTTNETASLLFWIERRSAVSAEASEAMLQLMERPLAPTRSDENQVKEFIGEAVPAGSKLWSKAGWTSEVRHDAAILALPEGRRLVLVVFTRGLAADPTLVPSVTRSVLSRLP